MDFDLQMKIEKEWTNDLCALYFAYPRLPFYFGEEVIPLNPKELSLERIVFYIEDNYKSVEGYYDIMMTVRPIWRFFTVFPLADFSVDVNASPQTRLTCINEEEARNGIAGFLPNYALSFRDAWATACARWSDLRQTQV